MAFLGSRWFTRGWTLQELVAPSVVKFFSQEWEWLGDRRSLARPIRAATGIPMESLKDHGLLSFSVGERMQWAVNRTTSRPEDKAYSLLGIVGVYMSLIYSEGERNALRRLRRELDLSPSRLGNFDGQEASEAPRYHFPVLTPDERKCMECLYSSDYQSSRAFNSERVRGTCEWFLETQEYLQWKEEPRAKPLWVSADPGCGKSVLASYLIEQLKRLESQKAMPGNVCYFFFKDNGQQNSSSLALRAMIHQIFTVKPSLIAIAVAELQNKGEKFIEDFETLWKIFTTAVVSNGGDVICVLDGLDESKESTRNLFFSSWVTSFTPDNQHNYVPKFIVTSRPQLSIERKFHNIPHTRLKFEDQQISSSRDIELVVRARVDAIGDSRGISYDVRLDLINRLINNAGGTFLWASLVLADIEKSARLSTAALKKLLANVPTTLDEVCEKILIQSSNREDAQTILQILQAAARPLTLKEMNVAFNITDQRHVSLISGTKSSSLNPISTRQSEVFAGFLLR